MIKKTPNSIFTIGHSTHPIEEFIEILQAFHIEMVVDIRRFPGSRKFPQFDKEYLEMILAENLIGYYYMKELGGRRKVNKNSHNVNWRNDSFRAYADYMETEAFEKGILKLEDIAKLNRVAYMCSEAVWWRCHRSMVSDCLKARAWQVFHIMSKNKLQEHPYTAAARVENDKVFYY
ncbi:MAG TPA: DUF488 domain-containing protein [Edaphocola sp.]|nr:DUF488 domain-containing protein [Edaphocola sp.]